MAELTPEQAIAKIRRLLMCDAFNASCDIAARDWAEVANVLEKRIGELERHYDAAGPEHNLLALLDAYLDRAQLAENALVGARDEIAALKLGLTQTPPPGTVAVELGERTVYADTDYPEDEEESEAYLTGGDACSDIWVGPDLERHFKIGASVSVTLVLKPVGEHV